MTFLELINNVKTRLDKNATTVPDTTTPRLKRFMNDRYRELMRIEGAGAEIRDETATVTATAGNPRLVLPQVMTAISSVVDTVNRVKLVPRSLGWIRRQDSSNPAMVTGTPWVYALLNEAGVSVQPSSPTASIAIAALQPDTRGFAVECQLPNGQYSVQTGVLNGLVNVPLLPVARIFRLQLDAVPVAVNAFVQIVETAPTAGQLMLLGNGPPAVARVMNQLAKHAWVLHLWPTPSAALQYSIDFARPVYELIDDEDEPAFPMDFHTLLVWGTCEEECLKMDDDRARNFRAKWEADLKAFRSFVHMSRGQRWIPSNRGARISTLGPFFPPDWS